MKVKKVLLILSISLNLILIGYLYLFNNQIENIPDNLGFRLIQNNLVELESAIRFEQKHNWQNHYHVLSKVDEIIHNIYITLDVSRGINKLEKEDENKLYRLVDFLEKFNKGGDFPDVELSEIEKESFIRLGQSLRSSGWGLNISYSSGWTTFINKSDKLIRHYSTNR